MDIFSNLECGRKYCYSQDYFSGNYNHNLYIKKSLDDGSNRLKFYISASTCINGNEIQQGYLYFYIDEKTKTSDFIGLKVSEEYRNLNIGSLLISSWIDLCLNNRYNFLGTNEKQRKPFLIYLLKKYGFDVLDKSLYNTRLDVITLYKSYMEHDTRKFILFKDSGHEKRFVSMNTFKDDNYIIIHDEADYIYLDKVILPFQNFRKDKIRYELIDKDIATKKVKSILSMHRK